MRSLNIAATGMLAQQTNVEVISNNIANMNTTAYSRRRAEFTDLLYQNLRRVGAASSDAGTIVPTGVQLGLGVKLASVYRITEQGSLQNTGNTLDLAIQGEGYFLVEDANAPGGFAYTRAGALQLNADGQIVTQDGRPVQGPGQVPRNAVGITINASGEVMIKLDGQQELQSLGTIQLATFLNEAGLEAVGNNLFIETPASGQANTANPGSTGVGTILQGFLESSNVNVVSEITNLISAQRAYEMNSKVIQTSDEMMSAINQLK